MEDWARSFTHTRRIYEALWLGSVFKPWTWNQGWGVAYMHVRQGQGRVVATFKGSFAKLRASARAERLHSKWVREHSPMVIRVSALASSIVKPSTLSVLK
jgi:hypothetical protein